MKEFFRKLILFGVVASLSYLLLIFIWGTFMPEWLQKNLFYKLGNKGHMYSRLQEVKQKKDVDILFVGSSLCLRGFDPRIFEEYGHSSFNLGSGGQTPIQSQWLIHKYVKQLNPKLVVLEVNPYVLSRDGVESGLDLVSNHDADLSHLNMILKIRNIRLFNTWLYAMMRDALGMNKNFREDTVKEEDTYVGNGYVEKQPERFNLSKYSRETKYKLDPVPYQKKAVRKIIRELNRRKTDVVMIQLPVTSVMLSDHMEAFKIDSFYVKQGKYYNFNPALYLNDTIHFFDSRHLNQEGVEVFNRYFIEEILQKEFPSLK